MRLRRERSCSVEMPGSTRWSSTKRRGPDARSRMISSVHLSPTRSSARASGDHWSYGCRLGGGGPGIWKYLRVGPDLGDPSLTLHLKGAKGSIFDAIHESFITAVRQFLF